MLGLSIGKISFYLRTLHLLRYVQAMPGVVENWFQDMRIFSYLERRKISKILKQNTFASDLFKIETSIRLRPNNWIHWSHVPFNEGNMKLYSIDNPYEKMELWLANKPWGLSFTVEGRKYGTVNIWSIWFSGYHIGWRRRLYRLGTKAVETKWIKNGPF